MDFKLVELENRIEEIDKKLKNITVSGDNKEIYFNNTPIDCVQLRGKSKVDFKECNMGYCIHSDDEDMDELEDRADELEDRADELKEKLSGIIKTFDALQLKFDKMKENLNTINE